MLFTIINKLLPHLVLFYFDHSNSTTPAQSIGRGQHGPGLNRKYLQMNMVDYNGFYGAVPGVDQSKYDMLYNRTSEEMKIKRMLLYTGVSFVLFFSYLFDIETIYKNCSAL